MTAVVGILNRRGAAIAADSAVTRHRGSKGEKITKNGNKMLRLSNVVPISIMLTGNGDFLHVQWDIVIRRYRQERGDIEHATVKDCAQDFFDYIASKDIFFDLAIVKQFILSVISRTYEDVVQAQAGARQGADIIAVIRTTGQSLLDYVPYGATTEGFGGTFATQ